MLRIGVSWWGCVGGAKGCGQNDFKKYDERGTEELNKRRVEISEESMR
jgi:hypothetical protein